MNKSGIQINITWGRLFVMLCAITILAIASVQAISSGPPSQSVPKIEVKEEPALKEIAPNLKITPPVHIRAKVMSVSTRVEGDHYVGYAILTPENSTEVGGMIVVAKIPGARVQRIFETALAMKNYNEPVIYKKAVVIDAVGYKTDAPEGMDSSRAVFYTISEAKIKDDELSSAMFALNFMNGSVFDQF
jgi:hypothetical protein